ncbi:YgaP family membrane protein [Sulfurimonas sp.]
MCFNAGKADRIVRVVAGLALIAYGVLNQNYIIAGIGAIPLLTGAIGFCPFYPIFKIDTGCKK